MTCRENRAILTHIYLPYASYYELDPDRFIWAGLATTAGYSVVFEILGRVEETQRSIAVWEAWEALERGRRRGFPFDVPRVDPDAILRRAVRRQMARVMDELGALFPSMALSIFLDITWQHEAYAVGGISAIEALFERREIDEDMLIAWRHVDSGDPARVRLGAEMIVEREQLHALHEGYARIDEMSFGMVAQKMSREAKTVIPGVPSFCECFPNGNFADPSFDPQTNERWLYIRDVAMPGYYKLSRRERDELIKGIIGELQDAQSKWSK